MGVYNVNTSTISHEVLQHMVEVIALLAIVKKSGSVQLYCF